MTREEYVEIMKRDDLEFVKLEVCIPKITYNLIKDNMYMPVDEDIICNAIRESKVLSEYTGKGDVNILTLPKIKEDCHNDVVAKNNKTIPYPEEKALRPEPGAFFHGESWYKCPKCGKGFEYFDTQFERGFKHVEGKKYRHIKDGCNQLLDMS